MDEIDFAEAGGSGGSAQPPPRPEIPEITIEDAAAALGGSQFEPHPINGTAPPAPQTPPQSTPSPNDTTPLEFTIRYDFSMLPSEDPDVYKPLEIVSYIGMTKPVGVANPVY
jgi:hypothetical protein